MRAPRVRLAWAASAPAVEGKRLAWASARTRKQTPTIAALHAPNVQLARHAKRAVANARAALRLATERASIFRMMEPIAALVVMPAPGLKPAQVVFVGIPARKLLVVPVV